MRKMIFVSMLILLSVLLAACAGSAPSTSSGEINVIVETDPNPVTTGSVDLILNVTDADGNPIEGATVDVSAEHSAMSGMGGAVTGVATEQGAGRYTVTADFGMTGTWNVTVYVRKDGLDAKQEIEFSVQ